MHSLMQCASQLTYGQPLDGLFSGYGLFLSSDSVLHWAVALQSGFNVDLTAPLTTARWTHVAGVVDARQGFAALYIDGVAVASQNFPPSAVSYRLPMHPPPLLPSHTLQLLTL
jgi:hypothetical protein